MRILLIVPHVPAGGGNLAPHLGIITLAASTPPDIEVSVIDENVENINFNDRFDMVGISAMTPTVMRAYEIADSFRQRGVPVVLGGFHPSLMHKEAIQHSDSVVIGEAESIWPNVIRDLKKGKLRKFYRQNTFENLNNTPTPRRDLLHRKSYLMFNTVETSRGCPYCCSFCFHSMGHIWRSRSPENVVEEIDWQVSELGVKEICIEDDNFLLDVKRAEKIFDLIIERQIKVNLQLHNGIRTENIDIRLLKKMKKAGVWLVAICPETGSPRIMKEINKNVDKHKVREIINWCRNIGIRTYVCFIFGFPFETIEDLNLTCSFINSLNPDLLQISKALPIPGTPLFERVFGKNYSVDFDREDGMFFGHDKVKSQNINNKQFLRMIKKTYRRFYFNPLRIVKLISMFPLRNLWRLFNYASKTKNI